MLRDSSMINTDFKFDLAEYLAAAGDPPVKSLGEILDKGLYHSALEANFRARNAIEQRDNEQSRRARIKRTALHGVVEAVLNEHKLVALVYPTLRRKPARIGDAQGGTNCQLSAHSGLPSLSIHVRSTRATGSASWREANRARRSWVVSERDSGPSVRDAHVVSFLSVSRVAVCPGPIISSGRAVPMSNIGRPSRRLGRNLSRRTVMSSHQ